MALAVKFEVLERFLKGELSPQDLATVKCTIVDQLLVMYALALAQPKQYFRLDDPTVLNISIRKLYNTIYQVDGTSAAQVSRMAGLHVSTGKGAAPVRLTLPLEALTLIERHKDNEDGGITKYLGVSQITGIASSEELAAAAINRLRSAYGPEVLAIIKREL